MFMYKTCLLQRRHLSQVYFFILQSLKSELELSNEFEIVIVAELLFLNFDVVMQNIVLAAWKLNDIN